MIINPAKNDKMTILIAILYGFGAPKMYDVTEVVFFKDLSVALDLDFDLAPVSDLEPEWLLVDFKFRFMASPYSLVFFLSKRLCLSMYL